MKVQWDDVKKRLDDLEGTGKLNWQKLSKRDLESVLSNSHKRQRRHWDAPAAGEIERRRHKTIMCTVGATLIVAIIGAVIAALQLITNCGK